MSELIKDLESQIRGYYDNLVILMPKLLMAIVVFLVLWFVASRISKRFVRHMTNRSFDPLLSKFMGRLIKVVISIIAISFCLNIIGMGKIATGLIGTAGVGAFVLGFAFKDIGEHFLAGVILAFNRPFNINDLVELGGVKGKVVNLNIRDTHIKTFDGRDIYIPNGNIIKNPLINYTIDGYIRNEFSIGVDYGSDINVAIKTILEVVSSIDGVLTEDKKPSVAIDSLGASSLNLTVYYWQDTFDKNVNGTNVKIEAITKTLTALVGKGINLPGDIIELKNYNDEKLKLVQ